MSDDEIDDGARSLIESYERQLPFTWGSDNEAIRNKISRLGGTPRSDDDGEDHYNIYTGLSTGIKTPSTNSSFDLDTGYNYKATDKNGNRMYP